MTLKEILIDKLIKELAINDIEGAKQTLMFAQAADIDWLDLYQKAYFALILKGLKGSAKLATILNIAPVNERKKAHLWLAQICTKLYDITS